MSEKRLFRVLSVILSCSFTYWLFGCSSDKAPDKVTYKPGGIVVKYLAESSLNSYDQSSHSLMLGVYQLNNINGFLQLSKDLVGTQKLLSLTKFDSTVEGVDSKFIYANESGSIILDRLENTRWVAVVAGYYNINPQQVVRQFAIPNNLNHDLTIDIILNADSIQEIKTK